MTAPRNESDVLALLREQRINHYVAKLRNMPRGDQIAGLRTAVEADGGAEMAREVRARLKRVHGQMFPHHDSGTSLEHVQEGLL